MDASDTIRLSDTPKHDPPRATYGRLRTPQQIGSALRDARRSADITQTDLAELVGMSRAHVARIENGDHNITQRTFQKFLEVLRYDMTLHPRAARRR